MQVTESDLKKIEELAYLDNESENHQQLCEDVNAIMDFVEQLRKVDTTGVPPLFHAFDQHQPLREDEVTDKDQSGELGKIAPSFEDGLYLVPKVIDSGQY